MNACCLLAQVQVSYRSARKLTLAMVSAGQISPSDRNQNYRWGIWVFFDRLPPRHGAAQWRSRFPLVTGLSNRYPTVEPTRPTQTCLRPPLRLLRGYLHCAVPATLCCFMHVFQWCSRCEWSLIFGRGCCFAVACPYRTRKGFKLLIIPTCKIKRKVWLVKIPRHKWTPSAPSHLCELSVSASRDVFDGNSGCDRFVTGPFRKSVHCGLIWLVNMTSGCEPLHCFHSVLFFSFL